MDIERFSEGLEIEMAKQGFLFIFQKAQLEGS
jgi:hypothetical protein